MNRSSTQTAVIPIPEEITPTQYADAIISNAKGLTIALKIT